METEPFGNTFGPKAQRKRPRLDIGSIEELGESSTSVAPIEGTSEFAAAKGGLHQGDDMLTIAFV